MYIYLDTTADLHAKTETAANPRDPSNRTEAMGRKVARGTYRAMRRARETEGASRLDRTVDKRPKEAGTGPTARD